MKKSAFTLIELLVVIVIVGILATISVAQFNEYQQRARIAKIQAFEAQADMVLMAATTADEQEPVGKWLIDEGMGTQTVASLSGRILDGVVTGGSAPFEDYWSTDTLDGTGYSLYMDDGAGGANIRSTGTSNAVSTNSEVTISARLKIGTNTNQGRVFITTCSDNHQLKFTVIGNSGFRLEEYDTSSWTTLFEFSDSGSLDRNRWYHVLLSYSPDYGAIYLDGELIYEDTDPVDMASNCSTSFGNQTTIGGGGVTTGFGGWLDSLSVYPKSYDPN